MKLSSPHIHPGTSWLKFTHPQHTAHLALYHPASPPCPPHHATLGLKRTLPPRAQCPAGTHSPFPVSPTPDALNSSLIIFVVGGPGSGKETQCKNMAAKYGFCHVGLGQLLRQEARQHTQRGRQIRDVMLQGLLVPTVSSHGLGREWLCGGWRGGWPPSLSPLGFPPTPSPLSLLDLHILMWKWGTPAKGGGCDIISRR